MKTFLLAGGEKNRSTSTTQLLTKITTNLRTGIARARIINDISLHLVGLEPATTPILRVGRLPSPRATMFHLLVYVLDFGTIGLYSERKLNAEENLPVVEVEPSTETSKNAKSHRACVTLPVFSRNHIPCLYQVGEIFYFAVQKRIRTILLLPLTPSRME